MYINVMVIDELLDGTRSSVFLQSKPIHLQSLITMILPTNMFKENKRKFTI